MLLPSAREAWPCKLARFGEAWLGKRGFGEAWLRLSAAVSPDQGAAVGASAAQLRPQLLILWTDSVR
jgi:hypothetical protein